MNFKDIPAIGKPLDAGIFAGITTKEGQHYAVVLLADKPEQWLDWRSAMEWAKSIGGVLPSRPVAALLFANCRDQFEKAWHWSDEEHEDSGAYAWLQHFYGGSQSCISKSFKYPARAIRLIVLK